MVATGAEAQPWPQRPIEIIIPFAAGGGVDSVGRAVVEALSKEIGQQFVVRNQAGAAGTIGFGALARAEPDGYTLGFGPTTPITNAPHLMAGVKYDVGSFDYVCQVFENVFTIAVRPDSSIRSAQDLFAAAAKNPSQLTYGLAGPGSIPHLSVGHRCINLGGLEECGESRSRPVVSVQAPPLSGRDHPVVRALVLQVRHQLSRSG